MTLIKIDKRNFDAFVNSSEPALILFWAEWLRRSEHIRATACKLSEEMPVGIVHEEDEPELAAKAYIRVFPALVLYGGGKAIRTLINPSSCEQMLAFVAGTQDKEETVRQKRELYRAMMLNKTERWFDETEGMEPVAGMEEITKLCKKWVTELMRDEPIMFRTYLEDFIKTDVDYGRYDPETGFFHYATVPNGFTVNDYHDWISKNATELLK